jgi:predicted nucleotidyltransferase component of viral defense system
MIPRAHITAWRAKAPWPSDAQVEQDLVVSRAIVELFRHPQIRGNLAFRGGTALHKLFFAQPGRYSEDIDLVQLERGAIGPVLDALRSVLDPWLGEARHKRGPDGTTLVYRFESTSSPTQPMRLKIEINTREQLPAVGRHRKTFEVDNPWFSGSADVATFEIEELLGTKLRALYQRKKGRDLYDLWLALSSLDVQDRKIVEHFRRYVDHEGTRISRAEFERNLFEKLDAPEFVGDLAVLIPTGQTYDVPTAGRLVSERLITKLAGEPWKGRRK